MALVTRTSLALERSHRDLPNRVRTSFTSVGNSDDSRAGANSRRSYLVVGEGTELAHHLCPLLILRDSVRAGHIPHINGEVPRKRRAALCPARFRVDDGLGQTVAAMSFVGPHVGIPERPEPKGLA